MPTENAERDHNEKLRPGLTLSQKEQLKQAVSLIPALRETNLRKRVLTELRNELGDQFDQVRFAGSTPDNDWLIVSLCLELGKIPALVRVLRLYSASSPQWQRLDDLVQDLFPAAGAAVSPDLDGRVRALLEKVDDTTVAAAVRHEALRDYHELLADAGGAVLIYELLSTAPAEQTSLLTFLELVGHQLGSYDLVELHRVVDDLADRWGLTAMIRDLCRTLAPTAADAEAGPPTRDGGSTGGDTTRGPESPDEDPPLGVDDVKITSAEKATPPAVAPTAPLVWGGVPPRNNNFTGRTDLLEQIHRSFAEHGRSVLVPQPLHGLGGIGKSQAAVEFAYRYQFDYQLVWWIQADDDQSIRRSLRSLARRLGLVESADVQDTVDAVLEVLRLGDPYPRWLLIYDNAPEPKVVRPYQPSGGEGHVLITSRSLVWASERNAIEIDVFTPQESVTLLCGRWPELTEETALGLAEQLGHLPLALEQAVALHEQTGIPLADYLRALDSSPHQILDEGTATNYPVSVAAALDLAYQSVKKSSPTAAYLLQLCAFLSSHPISIPLLVRGRNARAVADPAVDLRDDIVLRRAVRDLGRYALVQLDAGRDFIRVHALNRALLRDGIPQEQRSAIQNHAHAMLAAANPGSPDEPSTWTQHSQIAPHVGPAGLVYSPDDEVRRVVLDQIRYHFAIGDYAASRDLGRQAVDTWRASYGPDDELTLVACRHLANSLRVLGQYPDARELNEDTLAKMVSRFGENHEHTLVTASSVAADLRLAGAFQEALALDERNLVQHREVLGPIDPATLRAITNLAVDYRMLGNFRRARELDEENIALKADVYGIDHNRTLFSYSCLMRDLYGLGQYHQGLTLAREKLPIYEQKLPANHGELLLAKRNLAILLRKAGHHGPALEYTQELYEVCRAKFGRSHEHTLSALVTLANAHRVTGEYDTALGHGEGALVAYREVLGDGHPFTLACQVNVAIVLRLLGRRDEAGALNDHALAALTEALGADHPHAMCAANNRANGLAADGRADEARMLGQQTWERSRRIRGEHHPNTLGCAANLALDLEVTGQEVRATKLRKETFEMLRAKLGTDHPETLNANAYRRMESDVEVPPT